MRIVPQRITMNSRFPSPPRPIVNATYPGQMQTRYLLLASLITGLAILVAAALWMATRL